MMSPKRLALVVVAVLAVIVIAAGGWFWHATTNFNALVAEMTPFSLPGGEDRLAKAEARLASGKDDYDRWAHLPRVALGNAIYGDPTRAEALADELLAAAPQLNTFGPNMNLADELLRAGDREVVLAYIEKLGRFWKMDGGALRKWPEMIREGRHPNFAMNLY